MGAVDVIPGVSGGTIAFISGIYEELLETISNINFKLLITLRKKGIKATWVQANGNFLLAIFMGIGISIVSFAKLITWLLENYPIPLWSFFFGLVLASIWYIGKQIQKWNPPTFLLAILGLAFGYSITIIPSASSNDTGFLFLFFVGALVSCAMILPGISGSYILLLMGAYSTVIKAITEKDYFIITVVGIGVVVGLLFFSRVLKWLLDKFKHRVMAVLTGIMLGSINKIWPWKHTITTFVDRHGEEKPLLEKNILPSSHQGDSQLVWAIISMVVGFGLILLLERWATQKE